MFQRQILHLHPRLSSQISREFKRLLSTVQQENCIADRMSAWQIHSYDGISSLKCCDVRIPSIEGYSSVSSLLIKVSASSVNPIDLEISKGYAARSLNCLRAAASPSSLKEDSELPLTLGRDFSGVVVSRGLNIQDYEIGDRVWGIAPVIDQGCHAEYVLVDAAHVRRKPESLSCLESGGLLYTGITAWNALWHVGGLWFKTNKRQRLKRVLVLGGAGGVGSCAVQILRALKIPTVTTCSSDAVELVSELGADVVIDYKKERAGEEIIAEGPYELILDCANQGIDDIRSKGIPHEVYITLNAPFLSNIDKLGLIPGGIQSLLQFCQLNATSPNFAMNMPVRWAYMYPCQSSFDAIQNLAERKQLKPVIQEVFKFNDVPLAYSKLAEGHARGKIVIDFEK